jgi:hypothetical protein
VVHVTGILEAHYRENKLETQNLSTCFGNALGRCLASQHSIVTNEGFMHKWFPFLVRICALWRLETQLPQDIKPYIQSISNKFCNVCVVQMRQSESYACSHHLCLQCSKDLLLANDKNVEPLTRKVDAICCPVCNQVALHRLPKYIASYTPDLERQQSIAEAMPASVVEYVEISPSAIHRSRNPPDSWKGNNVV